MKLATIESHSPATAEEELDGRLIVVSADGRHGKFPEDERCRTMRRAMDNWDAVLPGLNELSAELNNGLKMESADEPLDLSRVTFKAPLPRATDFVDGSGYLTHIERARKARGAEPPGDMRETPLMYRGVPVFLGPHDPVEITDFTNGPDCEGEIAVIVANVPAGVDAEGAMGCVRLVTQINDVSLRELIKRELPRQFGFMASKPPSSAGPFAVTLDELGDSWNDGRPQFTMRITRNGTIVGDLDTSEIYFTLGDLISHAARTYPLAAGTVVGTGTISNSDSTRGVACIAEQVALDMIGQKGSVTPFLKDGEVISIECFGPDGRSLFGTISNEYRAAAPR